MALIGEAGALGNFGNREGSLGEQLGSLLDSDPANVLAWRLPEVLPESPLKCAGCTPAASATSAMVSERLNDS
jgi:hypothetical protein